MISRNKYWFPDEDGTYALFYTWFYDMHDEIELLERAIKDFEGEDDEG